MISIFDIFSDTSIKLGDHKFSLKQHIEHSNFESL